MILALKITPVTSTSDNTKMHVSLKKKPLLETVPTRCDGSRYITGARQSGRGPDFVAHVFDFLGVIRCNLVEICPVDGTCGQRPSCVRCSLICFCRSAKRSLHRARNTLGRPAWKRGVSFFTVVGLRFSSDKEAAKCKKMRIPADLEYQPVQISP